MRRFLSHWLGIVLAGAGVVATLWLAVTGQLALYIHPRYDVFTTVMAALGGLGVIGAIIALRASDARGRDGRGRHGGADGREHEHEHEHENGHGHDDEAAAGSGWRLAIATAGALLVTAGTVGALLVLPPSTLSSATVDARDMNASAIDLDGEPIQLAGVDTADFTVRDWSNLLAQGADPTYFTGMTPHLVGFVTADPAGSEDIFYVARFVVTCCAVDAQPVGVPVYSPEWQDRFAVDDWVEVTGSFVSNPDGGAETPVVLEPATADPVAQPDAPYIT